MPSTPHPRTNAVRPGRLATSSAPSGVNGVGTMFQTPRMPLVGHHARQR